MDRMADKTFATYEALKAELAAQAVSPDETGWRVGGRSAWLWAFAATRGVGKETVTSRHLRRGTVR